MKIKSFECPKSKPASQQSTFLFSIYQNNTWTIRHLVDEMINPATQRIIYVEDCLILNGVLATVAIEWKMHLILISSFLKWDILQLSAFLVTVLEIGNFQQWYMMYVMGFQ